MLIMDKIVNPLIEMRGNTNGLLTQRDLIWKYYIEMLRNNPLAILIGTGAGNSRYIVSNYAGAIFAPHNIYLEIICDIGIIGVVTICFFWSVILRNIKNILKNIKGLSIIMFFITSLALSISSFDTLYIILPLLTLLNIEKQH